jgi:hypothetical protein
VKAALKRVGKALLKVFQLIGVLLLAIFFLAVVVVTGGQDK